MRKWKMHFSYEAAIRILILLFTVLLAMLAWDNYAIWLDELFTLNLIRLPAAEAIAATAADVHPPLYYLLVQLFCRLMSLFGMDAVIASKLFSVIPMCLLMILASRMLYRRYGGRTALLFLIMLFGTRVIMYAVEIRMYSLAMLCVIMAYLYANEIRYDDRPRNWILFTLWSVLGAYTHYDAVIAESLIYFWLLYRTIQNKTWKKWLACFAASVVSFLPWFFVILSQLRHANDGWGGQVTLRDLVTFFVYPFYTNNIPLTGIIAVFTVLLALAAFLRSAEKDGFTAACELNPLYVGIIGIVISLITKKFFTGKYLLPGWAAFWLGLSISLRNSRYWKQIAAVFLILNSATYLISWQKEDQDRRGYYRLKELIENSSDTSFQADGTIAAIIQYYQFRLGSNSIRADLGSEQPADYAIIYTDLHYSADFSNYKTVETFMLGGASVSVLSENH